MFRSANAFVFIISALINKSECADILLISNCVSHSHSMWYNKLATLLVNSGHQIVLLDTDPLKAKVGNITHFLIEDAYDFSGLQFTPEMMEDYSEMTSASSFENLDSYLGFSVMFCRKFLNSNGVKTLMKTYKNKKFDLIITDYYCDSFLGFVPYFGNPPYIIATAFADPEMVLDKVGLYDNPSYVPARMFSSLPPVMEFSQRFKNTLYYLYLHYKLNYFLAPLEEANAKEVFGNDSPSLFEIGRNVSLVFVNTHFSISGAKPLLPAVIPVAGFHIEQVKPLPKDIKSFLDGAENGAILFSFGSNLQPEMITTKKVKMFLEVFSSIPQRVIWKFNESLIEKVPSNVMVKSWTPQTDILNHENMVGFISHGGLLGSQEAMHFGVPIIGVPFGIDQGSNVDMIVREGLGVKLSFKYIDSESLKQAIYTIVTDKSYMEKMKQLSRILRDKPMEPKDVMKYWIEYVLRNRNHLSYIRSQAANLNMFQLLLLDVIAIIVVPIAFLLIITSCVIKILVRIMVSRYNKTKEKEQ